MPLKSRSQKAVNKFTLSHHINTLLLALIDTVYWTRHQTLVIGKYVYLIHLMLMIMRLSIAIERIRICTLVGMHVWHSTCFTMTKPPDSTRPIVLVLSYVCECLFVICEKKKLLNFRVDLGKLLYIEESKKIFLEY